MIKHQMFPIKGKVSIVFLITLFLCTVYMFGYMTTEHCETDFILLHYYVDPKRRMNPIDKFSMSTQYENTCMNHKPVVVCTRSKCQTHFENSHPNTLMHSFSFKNW